MLRVAIPRHERGHVLEAVQLRGAEGQGRAARQRGDDGGLDGRATVLLNLLEQRRAPCLNRLRRRRVGGHKQAAIGRVRTCDTSGPLRGNRRRVSGTSLEKGFFRFITPTSRTSYNQYTHTSSKACARVLRGIVTRGPIARRAPRYRPCGLAEQARAPIRSSSRHPRWQRALHEHAVVGAGDLDVHVLVEALLPLDGLKAAAARPLLGPQPHGELGLDVLLKELIAPSAVGHVFACWVK